MRHRSIKGPAGHAQPTILPRQLQLLDRITSPYKLGLRETQAIPFFADRMSPSRLEAILGEYEGEARARWDRLGEVVERLADRPQAAFRRATAMFGVRREQAKLDWVTEVRPLLLAAASSGLARGGEEC